MKFDDWCAAHGDYLNDSDDAAKAARLMARRAWDALRAECAVLAGLLRDCDLMLASIDDGDEADQVRGLRMALAYALDPYKRDGTLL